MKQKFIDLIDDGYEFYGLAISDALYVFGHDGHHRKSIFMMQVTEDQMMSDSITHCNCIRMGTVPAKLFWETLAKTYKKGTQIVISKNTLDSDDVKNWIVKWSGVYNYETAAEQILENLKHSFPMVLPKI